MYEGLLDGVVYPDELDEMYEDLEDSDTTYFELTTNNGQTIAG